MSTEFVSTTTEEVGFVRFCRTSPCGARTSFEFGTVSNFEAVVAAMRGGDRFVPWGSGPLEGDPVTAEDVEAMVASGRATFGEFPVTVEVGSGEMFRFSVEQ
jgi:hypothetical protein